MILDDSVTPRWRRLLDEAESQARMSVNLSDVEVRLVDEPQTPGHNDFACTVYGPPVRIEIRRGIESIDHPLNARQTGVTASNLETWLREIIVHEFAHVAISQRNLDDAGIGDLAANFTTTKTGSLRKGTLTDWHQPDEWEDRIEEATAEILKDAALTEEQRVFDNRTRWAIDEAGFKAVVGGLDEGGGGALNDSSPPKSISYNNQTWRRAKVVEAEEPVQNT